MRYTLFGILLVFFFHMNVGAFADIQFQSCEIKDEVSPLKDEYAFEFRFKNTGTDSVEISSINASCFCIKTVPLEKNIFKKGESGIIRGVVDISGKSGIERQKIILETRSNNETARVPLYVQLQIQKILEISPTVLFWNLNQSNGEKTALLNLNANFATDIAGVVDDSNSFIFGIQKDEAKKKSFRFHIRPKSTSVAIHQTIRFKVRTIDGNERIFSMHALIK